MNRLKENLIELAKLAAVISVVIIVIVILTSIKSPSSSSDSSSSTGSYECSGRFEYNCGEAEGGSESDRIDSLEQSMGDRMERE